MVLGPTVEQKEQQSAVEHAVAFATQAHRGQLRKYVERPYIEHPLAVARLVQRFEHDEAMVVAAVLHDVREDCGVTREEVASIFGSDVDRLVDDLTDVSRPEDGNRAARKTIDLAHSAGADPRAKTIKCLDLVHNTATIVAYAPGFARTYLPELARLLEVLTDASDPRAHQLACRVRERAVARLRSMPDHRSQSTSVPDRPR